MDLELRFCSYKISKRRSSDSTAHSLRSLQIWTRPYNDSTVIKGKNVNKWCRHSRTPRFFDKSFLRHLQLKSSFLGMLIKIWGTEMDQKFPHLLGKVYRLDINFNQTSKVRFDFFTAHLAHCLDTNSSLCVNIGY